MEGEKKSYVEYSQRGCSSLIVFFFPGFFLRIVFSHDSFVFFSCLEGELFAFFSVV